MRKRGSYFFVLDAMIGGAIFLVTVIIIISSQLNTPDKRQSYLLANDVMYLLSTTKIIDFRNPYISTLANDGNITDYEQSLFLQISEFYYTNRTELAKNLTKAVLETVILEQYGVSYSIGDEIIYNRFMDRFNNSRMALTSRKLSFLIINETTYFGPDVAELKIWI
ncbi:MAG: hypothetical protein KJ583_06050 [Nanoarchaeota archaeon]|nr:hypothetical protein [Nanoarchaeota archaeon]MBU1270264.1 hypothetical protein [Nanoarchaeota archaeon]MBU1604848.1 hypothetical protein [Nanoarchaeota archaeon]MBU2442482.1 hypothetical protein [Nanoarchaeota archaeon]